MLFCSQKIHPPEIDISAADPAANTEFSITVPVNQVWEVLAVSVACVQGATQTPWPSLQIDDGTTVFALLPGSTAAQAVSTTCQYTWAVGQTTSGQIGLTTAVRSAGTLPDNLVLNAGDRLLSLTVGIGANTNYGVPAVRIIRHKLA